MIFFIPMVILSCKQGLISTEYDIATEDALEYVTIGRITYGNYAGVWYTVANGRKGDEIILSRLIVRPKPGIDMNNFDFPAVGVPPLSIINVFLDDFFILDTSELSDPIDIAKKLWDTGLFESVEFDAYGTRL